MSAPKRCARCRAPDGAFIWRGRMAGATRRRCYFLEGMLHDAITGERIGPTDRRPLGAHSLIVRLRADSDGRLRCQTCRSAAARDWQQAERDRAGRRGPGRPRKPQRQLTLF